jgi:hypothetical protein
MKTAARRLVTVALACAAVAAPSLDRSFDPRVAGEWANAVIGVLTANAYGYGPGYNYSPGYAFSRGPDIGALAVILQARAGSFPAAGAKATTIAETRWLDDQSQPSSYRIRD